MVDCLVYIFLWKLYSALKLICELGLLFFSSSSEIPQFRLPFGVVDFEIEQMKDLGVKVHYKYKDVSMTSLV